MTHDPDTPPSAEATLADLSGQMEQARQELRKARDAEVEAEHVYRSALRRALLSPECPKVGFTREDGMRVTVAYRDAWAEDKAAREEHAWQLAKATRRAAADHLSTLKAQVSAQQSITSSVRESYRGTGRPW